MKKKKMESLCYTGPLIDFYGNVIDINVKGINIPVEAELVHKNDKNILNLFVKIKFLYCEEKEYIDNFEKAVLDAIKSWQGKYMVFGGQDIEVNVFVENEAFFAPVEYIYALANGSKLNIIPMDSEVINKYTSVKVSSKCVESKRSFVEIFSGWKVDSKKNMYIFARDNKFTNYDEIKNKVKHEFGHVIGLGDLYKDETINLNGVEKGQYCELDRYHIKEEKYNLVMHNGRGEISNNDIEMVILAFWKNEQQNYQPQFNIGISDALGRGN